MQNFGITVVGIKPNPFFVPCENTTEANNLQSYYYKLGASFVYYTWQ